MQSYGPDPDDFDDGTSEPLYPQRNSNTLATRELLNAPRALKGIYKEVISCFNNDAPVMCAAGLRAAIEGICENQKITGGLVIVKDHNGVALTNPDGSERTQRSTNLEGKISGLHEKGILTAKAAESLHEHRFLGNSAVHKLSRPSDEELKIAIEMVEHILEHLYEFPEKVASLRFKRAKSREIAP